MPDVTLRAMIEAEFGEWKPRAIQRYGEQQVQAGNVSADKAQEWAAGEYAKLLPQGLHSRGHHLLIAEQESQRIGMLWLFIHAGDRPAFVYYVEVDPAIRGQGLGRAVMTAGEQYVTEHGATSIGLHVFGHNLVARRLYDQMGYQVSSSNMIKSLT
ncbi:MAG: GNAT family N-acetyltransferase [Geodermatophilaceae bacterium]|nr:GNAT family N-acetyltransferase [Geodermatophilaceae bacterium]